MGETIPFYRTADGGVYHGSCYNEVLLIDQIENPALIEQLTSATDEIVLCDYCN